MRRSPSYDARPVELGCDAIGSGSLGHSRRFGSKGRQTQPIDQESLVRNAAVLSHPNFQTTGSLNNLHTQTSKASVGVFCTGMGNLGPPQNACAPFAYSKGVELTALAIAIGISRCHP